MEGTVKRYRRGGGGGDNDKIEPFHAGLEGGIPTCNTCTGYYRLYFYTALATFCGPCPYTRFFKKSFTNVTVWRVLRKGLHLRAYQPSIIQYLTNADNVVREEISMQMFHKPEILWVWREIDYRSAALAAEVTLNHNYAGLYLVCFATLWQFKTLYTSSE
jgi:hypothetical protein